MSIEIAKAWSNRSLCSAGARRDVAQFLDQAAAVGGQATLLVTSEVMTGDKGCLARWTGDELVVVELSASQELSLGLPPRSVSKLLEPRPLRTHLPPERLVTLGDVRIDGEAPYDGRQPLTGICSVTFEAGASQAAGDCALQVQYVHGGLHRQITGYWYPSAPLQSWQRELRFTFSPLISSRNPLALRGTLFLFFQLFSARDWRTQAGCKSVSNVAVAAVNMCSTEVANK